MDRLSDLVRLKVIPNAPTWAPLVVLVVGVVSLPVLFILIWDVSSSRPHAAPLPASVQASSRKLAGAQSAKTGPAQAAPAPGTTCSEIASSGNKILNSINSEITQQLNQAHQSAASGNYAASEAEGRSANTLGKQGASDQEKYAEQLQSLHCGTEYLTQLTQ